MAAEFANLNITALMPQEGQAGGDGHGEVEARHRVWKKEVSHLRGKRLDIKRRAKKEAIGGCLWHANNRTVSSTLFRSGGSGASDVTLQTSYPDVWDSENTRLFSVSLL